MRLQGVDDMKDGVPVIDLDFSVRPLTVGSVKPHLVNLSIVGEQFRELGDEEFVIGW